MKLFFILFVVVSCTSGSKKEKIIFETPADFAGESEARPVSPYSVEPCYCRKIFLPVCAGGKTFANSCEAECHGFKSWSEGACTKKQKEN